MVMCIILRRVAVHAVAGLATTTAVVLLLLHVMLSYRAWGWLAAAGGISCANL